MMPRLFLCLTLCACAADPSPDFSFVDDAADAQALIKRFGTVVADWKSERTYRAPSGKDMVAYDDNAVQLMRDLENTWTETTWIIDWSNRGRGEWWYLNVDKTYEEPREVFHGWEKSLSLSSTRVSFTYTNYSDYRESWKFVLTP